MDFEFYTKNLEGAEYGNVSLIPQRPYVNTHVPHDVLKKAAKLSVRSLWMMHATVPVSFLRSLPPTISSLAMESTSITSDASVFRRNEEGYRHVKKVELTNITMQSGVFDQICEIGLLSSPVLTDVRIGMDILTNSDPPTISALLRAVETRNLERLHLDGFHVNTQTLPQLAELVRGCSMLVSLSLCMWVDKDVRSLAPLSDAVAHCRHLDAMTVRVTGSEYVWNGAEILRSCRFIKTMNVTNCRIEMTMNEILQSIIHVTYCRLNVERLVSYEMKPDRRVKKQMAAVRKCRSQKHLAAMARTLSAPAMSRLPRELLATVCHAMYN